MSLIREPAKPEPGDFIRVQWDRIRRSPDCILINGEPAQNCTGIKLEWGDNSPYFPTLTLTQFVLPAKKEGEEQEVSHYITMGYLVPHDLYDEFVQWQREQRRRE